MTTEETAGLIADCERRAAAGEKPVMEWDEYHAELFVLLLDGMRFARVSFNFSHKGHWSVSFLAEPDGPYRAFFGSVTKGAAFTSLTAAQLFAEQLLRDACRPLFRKQNT